MYESLKRDNKKDIDSRKKKEKNEILQCILS